MLSASQSMTTPTASQHRYELIVYYDDDTAPINLVLTKPASPATMSASDAVPTAAYRELKAALLAALQGKVPEIAAAESVTYRVSVWDPVARRYALLVSPQRQLDAFGFRGQLWVEPQLPARLLPVAQGSDDFALLVSFVDGIGNGVVGYDLLQAHRVHFPKLEKRFQTKKAALAAGIKHVMQQQQGTADAGDPEGGPSALLFYMNNGAPCSAILRGEGFTAPDAGEGNSRGISFALNVCDPEQRVVTPQPMNVLLCEVAHGIIYEGPESGFRKDLHGTLLLRSKHFGCDMHVVFDSDQAIPRFVLTIKCRPHGKGSEVAAARNSQQVGGPADVMAVSARSPHVQGTTPAAKSLDFSSASAQRMPIFNLPPLTTRNNSSNLPAALPQRAVGPAPAATSANMSDVGNNAATLTSGSPAIAVGSTFCAAHPTEARTLWCSDCAALVCPYCLTVGAHRGHDGRMPGDVVPHFRTTLLEASTALSTNRDSSEREIELMQNGRRRLQTHIQATQKHLRETLQAVHQALHTKEITLNHELMRSLQSIDEALVVRRAHVGEVAQLQHQVDEHTRTPLDGPAAAKVRFLSLAPQLLRQIQDALKGAEGRQAAASLVPTEVPPALQLHPPLAQLLNVAESLRLVPSALEGPAALDPVATNTASAQSVPAIAQSAAPALKSQVPQTPVEVEMTVMRQQLRDVQHGYVWVVPNAAEHLGAQQTGDVFSDVFTLKGERWEVSFSPCTSPDHPADSLGVFLHPVEHQRRMDFRVIALAPGHWYARPCKAWPEAARGKPWGVTPFVSRQQLLSQLVCDQVLKICVTPIGELY